MSRNPELDKRMPEDRFIGKLQADDVGGKFRMIHGRKIYQSKETTQHDKDHNLICNRMRAMKMRSWDYLHFSTDRQIANRKAGKSLISKIIELYNRVKIAQKR